MTLVESAGGLLDSIQYTLGEPVAPEGGWTAAVVIQGPHTKTHTENAIRIFLERNPPSVLVIVATYHPPEARTADSFLSLFERQIALYKMGPHTGRLVYLFLNEPDKTTYPDFHKTNFWNQNSQRHSSFMGLQYARSLGIPYALKIRSDAFLGMPNVCEYLEAEVNSLPPFFPQGYDTCKLSKRIVVSDYTVRQCDNARSEWLGPHQVADLWFFGLTTDLRNYFDIRPASLWDNGAGMRTDCAAENNITEMWMRDLGITTKDGSGELTARYMVVVSRLKVEYVSPKADHNYEKYMSSDPDGGVSHLEEVFSREKCVRLRRELWESLLEKYKV